MNALVSKSIRTITVLFFLGASLTASAQFRTFSGYDSNTLPRNDDGSTGLVSLGFDANFFGTTYSGVYLNNNGNLTFNGPMATFNPFPLLSTSVPIIAPFFSDVDTRGLDSGVVTYGTGVIGGRNAFAANWPSVAHYSMSSTYNSFQVVLIDRSDRGVGHFDFEFNYEMINWDRGGNVRIGYSNGSDAAFELPGSGVSGAFLDTNLSSGLIHNQLGTPFDGAAMDGRYAFSVAEGDVHVGDGDAFTPVPEPSTYGVLGALALLGIIVNRRVRDRRA